MSTQRVFVGRLVGCGVFDPNGDRLGKVRDVIVVYRHVGSPRVVGLVVEIPGRRQVFVSIGRVIAITSGQVITTGLINVRRFEKRAGEVRVLTEMIGRNVELKDGGTGTIEDVAIESERRGEWFAEQVFLRLPKTGPTPFGKGPTKFVPWNQIVENESTGGAQSAEKLVASYSDMHASELADALRDLPEERRQDVAEELPDERLADALEEMPEHEQAEILSHLDDERAADVLDVMEPDDAADLLAQLPTNRVEALLALMEPEEAEDVRTLLKYGPETAGGLMTTEPIILAGDSTVAEALALIRRHELHPALAAAVFVTLPPFETPTGTYLGTVHFQRMLRYPPSQKLGDILDTTVEPVSVDASASEVARILASYDLVSIPVVDENRALVGVVSVDDVLDYLLPKDWRTQEASDAAGKKGANA